MSAVYLNTHKTPDKLSRKGKGRVRKNLRKIYAFIYERWIKCWLKEF